MPGVVSLLQQRLKSNAWLEGLNNKTISTWGNKMTEDQLKHTFTYHRPNSVQQAKYALIRDAALEFSRVLVANTPASADQTAAVRKVREAVMTANAAIALAE